MRISELFNALDEQTLDELLPVPEREMPAVSARDIRRRVSRTLDEDPVERRRHMKQLFKKGVCAALVAASLLTGAFAASQMDFWQYWFENGTGDLSVNTQKESIESTDLRLTLEESLADDNHALVIFSVTALSDTGRKQLYSDGLTGGGVTTLVGISPDPNASQGGGMSYQASPIVERDTEGQRFFRAEISLSGPNVKPVLYLHDVSTYISIPVTANIQSISIPFDGRTVSCPLDTVVRLNTLQLSSLGWDLDYDLVSQPNAANNFVEYQIFYLVTKNGTLKTMTQLMDAQNWFYWREVLDLDTVEGVVVDNTEYFLDGRAPQPYAVPEQLQFAELDTYNISQGGNQYEGILLRELVEKLGGMITWNNKTQSATVTYRGVTAIFTANASTFVRNSRSYDPWSGNSTPCTVLQNNRLYLVNETALQRALDVRLCATRIRKSEEWEFDKGYTNHIWIVAP